MKHEMTFNCPQNCKAFIAHFRLSGHFVCERRQTHQTAAELLAFYNIHFKAVIFNTGQAKWDGIVCLTSALWLPSKIKFPKKRLCCQSLCYSPSPVNHNWARLQSQSSLTPSYNHASICQACLIILSFVNSYLLLQLGDLQHCYTVTTQLFNARQPHWEPSKVQYS